MKTKKGERRAQWKNVCCAKLLRGDKRQKDRIGRRQPLLMSGPGLYCEET